MKRERDPTPEEFETLLAWLDSDREEAGIKLNLIHTRLIRIFVSRGCIDAEYLADEVINRVTVRIDQVKATYSDPLRCCVGFADNVHREWLRDQKKNAHPIEPPPPRPADELEREDVCLTRCVAELTEAERHLFKRYFQGEKRARIDARKKLAAELELTANALRIQAYRIRRKTHKCMEKCLNET
jgi:hypothetical protein